MEVKEDLSLLEPKGNPVFLLKISKNDKISIFDSIESNSLITSSIIEPYLKKIFESLVKQSNVINGISKNAFKNVFLTSILSFLTS